MIYPHNKLYNFIIILLCMVFAAGCAHSSAADTPQENTSIMPEDISAEYDETTASNILLGDRISISGSGTELQKNAITIFKGGTYIFEGVLKEGQIIVNAENADVHIVLKNASVTCSYSAALYVKSAARVILTLAEDTENSLSDMASRPSDDSIDGAVYSKAPLAITGSGSLMVSGAYKHGIASKGAVTICGGNISLSALKTGLDCKEDIMLDSCSLNIEAGTNGIRSGKEDNAAGISISGGSYAISSAGDGVQAYGDIAISDGDIVITTGGGSGEAPVKYSEFSMNGRGAQASEAEDDTSRKGIKAAGAISLSGGSCTVDSYDDGMHADGSITISGGSHSILSGDDGIHAEAALLISGGNIDIPYCYEGLEGKSVTIAEGTINIHANDDGINTASDESEETDRQPSQADIGAMPQMPENMIPPNAMEPPDGSTPPDGMEISEGFTPHGMGDMPENITSTEDEAAPEGTATHSPATNNADGNTENPRQRPSGGKDGRGNSHGGFGGMDGETAQEGVDIAITGGAVTVSAEGDCLDSNGNIVISGGTVYVSASRYPIISMAEAGLDCNGSLTVSGGSLIGTGTSASQTTGLEDAAIVYYGDSTFDETTPLALSDSEGNILFEFTSAHSFNSVLIASPALIVGETYTLSIGDASEEIQLTEQLLTVGESSGGFGSMGGFGGRHDNFAPFDPQKVPIPSPVQDTSFPSA